MSFTANHSGLAKPSQLREPALDQALAAQCIFHFIKEGWGASNFGYFHALRGRGVFQGKKDFRASAVIHKLQGGNFFFFWGGGG